MSELKNFVYRSIGGAVKRVPVDLPTTLGPKEVLINITHSSLCETDLHCIPHGIALGHEGVGIVEKVGSEVPSKLVTAGGGYLRSSCGHCSYCLKGQDIRCYERNIYRATDYHTGTFGDYYIGVETYVHRIPDNLSSKDAAPLQCAGSTVCNAIISSTKPGDRVGIIGIGGLGHLAIQFAAKMGFETIVFLTSTDKEDEARRFGATEFYLLSELEKVAKPVDILNFAAQHDIRPVIEKFPFDETGLAEAIQRLNDGKLRYRGVLVAAWVLI